MTAFQTLEERCTLRPTGLGLKPRSRSAAVLLCAAAMLGGCAVGPDFVAPKRPSEQTYVARPNTDLGAARGEDTGQHLAMGHALQADWWVLLQSPELNSVVDLALAGNLSIDSARANLSRSRSINSAIRSRKFDRSAAGFCDQSRNAFSAAATARSTSCASLSATCEYGLPVAGSTLSRYFPLTGSTNWPLIKLRTWNGSARMVRRKVKCSSSKIERSKRKNCSGQAV